MAQEENDISTLTMEQIANTRRILDRIVKLPDSQQSVVYGSMLEYMNKLEAGISVANDCEKIL